MQKIIFGLVVLGSMVSGCARQEVSSLSRFEGASANRHGTPALIGRICSPGQAMKGHC